MFISLSQLKCFILIINNADMPYRSYGISERFIIKVKHFHLCQYFLSYLLMLCSLIPELFIPSSLKFATISTFLKLYFSLNAERQMMPNTEETAREKRLPRNKRRPRNPLSERRRKRKRSRGLKGQTLSQTAA